VVPAKGSYIPYSQDSAKLGILESLLKELRPTREKIVLVSNFTKTLDILQSLLQSLNFTWCRLDGDTDSSKRQHIVDQFNSYDSKTCCILPPLSTFYKGNSDLGDSCVSFEFEEWGMWIEFNWGFEIGII